VLRVFPVVAPAQWSDTFGLGGHQGEDIFASRGRAVVAVDDGRVTDGTDPKGGRVVYQVTREGDRVYYAHLEAYGDGTLDARKKPRDVAAGDVIGYVGDSGNALGRGTHLHFEFTPAGASSPQNPTAALNAAAPAPTRDPLPSSQLDKKPLPSSRLAAKAILYAWSSKYPARAAPVPGIVYLLSQALTVEGGFTEPFRATNNFAAMHATSDWAKAHANDAGYGMVAFRDSGPDGSYITRMRVYPSLALGARGFLDTVEGMIGPLAAIETADQYARKLYVKGYYTGVHPTPDEKAQGLAVTPLMQRTESNLNEMDLANVDAYTRGLNRGFDGARAAFTDVPNEEGDPTVKSVGPPFASLAERLTSDGPPHTLEEARRRLGARADHPPPGAISLADALAAPGGDGVWLFPLAGKKDQPPAPPKKKPASSSTASKHTAITIALVALGIVGAGGAAVMASKKERAA